MAERRKADPKIKILFGTVFVKSILVVVIFKRIFTKQPIMKTFKLVIPADEDLPQRLRISLSGHSGTEIDIHFSTAINNKVIEVELDADTPTTLNGTDDKTSELLSQIDIESSGGFIPPDIAKQLDEEEDEVVWASQCQEEEEEPVNSVIPGLYSPAEQASRKRSIESSFEDECFVPATQQHKLEDGSSEDDVIAVILSSDEEEEEADANIAPVGRIQEERHPPARENLISTPIKNTVPVVVEIDNDPDGDAGAKAAADSDDSFTGEPMMPDSQPVEPILKKKFVKKKNVVVLSSDDEEEDAENPGVQKGLPDFETEPLIGDVEPKRVSSLAGDEEVIPETDGVDRPSDIASEPLEKSGTEEHSSGKSVSNRINRSSGWESFDEDIEILTGVQMVEDTENQAVPRPVASGNSDIHSEERTEIPETEEQQKFKAPYPVEDQSMSAQDARTQESLKLTLLSESERAETAPGVQVHEDSIEASSRQVPTGTPNGASSERPSPTSKDRRYDAHDTHDYVYLRTLQQHASDAARRRKVAEWLASSPAGPNEEYASLLEDANMVEEILDTSTRLPPPESPIISTASETDEKDSNGKVDKKIPGVDTPSRKRSSPPEGLKSSEKRRCDDSAFDTNVEQSRTPSGAGQSALTGNPCDPKSKSSGKAEKSKVFGSPQAEVLVAETVPEEEVLAERGLESKEIEETPVQENAPEFTKPTLEIRRPTRSRSSKTSSVDMSKAELPDPYAKETIEVDPPSKSRTRRAVKKSESKGASPSTIDFSEEINPELIEARPLRSRDNPKARPGRVRSLSNVNEPDQSNPKRSRLIEKSSSISTLASRRRRSSEDHRVKGNQGEDSSMLDHSVASSDSSLGVTRLAKARVMFTGIENPPRDGVLKLGLKLTDMISQCNVVVAAKFTRTVKMMYAIAKGIPVLSSNWVTESLEANKVLDIDNFMLRDEAAEEKYGFSLENTLRMASEKKFFKGWSFYVTKSCSPSAEQLGEILSGCKAKIITRVPTKFTENTVVVTCAADRKLLPKKPPVPAVSVEFVFHGILQHQLDFKTYEVI
ncbi:mediator of DNA damage checkpoint protein 1 [Galendromus occidentalis]|uniref:PAX-interacting protein 1 n=1 Tax=Galendromus occidentalis TaxID=34638 RepID=A0AAJ7L5W8_9ACAR|nr:mediator of DNA damage checkpoint protein 1 [Galendromus occidentalis]